MIRSFKLGETQDRKLEQLSRETGRSVSGVLRLLIERAELTGKPDFVVKEIQKQREEA